MSRKAGGSLRSLRRSNEEQIIALLLTQGPLHRAELARQAGVSRTTVSTIVGELVDRGLIITAADEPAGDLDGRAGNRLLMNPRAAVVAGMNHTFDGIWVHLSDLAAGRSPAPARPWIPRPERPRASSADLVDRTREPYRLLAPCGHHAMAVGHGDSTALLRRFTHLEYDPTGRRSAVHAARSEVRDGL